MKLTDVPPNLIVPDIQRSTASYIISFAQPVA
jgi:hypothetical protein